MNQQDFTPDELAFIENHFKIPLEELTEENYKQQKRALQKLYHPDKIIYTGDEEATAEHEGMFKRLQVIFTKIELHLQLLTVVDEFAYTDLKIEIMTFNKDFKYHLFGSRYRNLNEGDRYYIKYSNAYLTIDNDHRGNALGYIECVRLYLTFSRQDVVEYLVLWLYIRLVANADYLIINRKKIKVDFEMILAEIKQISFLQIAK